MKIASSPQLPLRAAPLPKNLSGRKSRAKNPDVSRLIAEALDKIPENLPQGDPLALVQVDEVRKKYGLTGKGVGVAVVDTGFDFPEYRLKAWKDTSREKSPQPVDVLGHGTHCAGDILNAAPQIDLAAVKMMRRDLQLSEAEVAEGIEWAVENKEKYNLKVLSFSFGWIPQYELLSSPPYLLTPQDIIGPAVQKAAEAGLTVVMPANSCGPGNYTLNQYADLKSPLIVGSARDENTVSWFSGRGPSRQGEGEIDVLAPGHLPSLNARGSRLEKGALASDRIRRMSNPELRKQLAKNPRLLKKYHLPGDPEAIDDATLDLVFRGKAELPPELRDKAPEMSNFELRDYLKTHPQVQKNLRLFGDPDNLSEAELDKVFKGGLTTSRLNAHILMLPGTSFACPLLAGVVALLYEADPDLSTEEIRSVLKETARALPGYDKNAQGAGLIDALAAVEKVYELKRKKASREN